MGVLYGARPANLTPDVERLLVETAIESPRDPRLAGAAASWLAQYARVVARHRLIAKVHTLDREVIATIGLLLDLAGQGGGHVLEPVTSACKPADSPHPLFEVDRQSEGLAEFARSNASSLSLRWNLWADVEIRPKIIRPPEWVFGMNPSFRMRAILGGGLRASILACLEWDAPEGASEAELARLCRVTRKALHDAMDHLEFCQFVHRVRAGRCYRVTLNPTSARAAM